MNRLLLAAVAAGLFLAAADAYVVASVLPFMVSDLGIPLDKLEQATPIVTGFLLGYVFAMPMVGAAPGRRGRGVVYVAALAAFALGSVLTATAEDLPRLVAGRVLQGLAGGAMVPVAIALAAELFTGAAVYTALGVVAAVQELGSLAGPVYGSAVTQWLAPLGGWRAIFWVNLPLAALCALAYLLAARRAPAPVSPASFRWRGALLLGGALALLVVALYSDDPAHRPVSENFAPLAAGAAVLFALFALEQARGGSPMLSRGSISIPLAGGLAVSLLSGVGLVAVLAEVPLMARTFLTGSDFQSAYVLVWFLAGVPVGALLGGLVARLAPPAIPAAAGLAMAGATLWVMSGWGSTFASGPQALVQIDLTLALCGLGFGLAIAPVTATVVASASEPDRGAASALVVLTRTMGMLAGLAGLAAYGLHRAYQLLLACGPLKFNPVFLACATNAVVAQFQEIFAIAAVACAAAALLALTLRRPRPHM